MSLSAGLLTADFANAQSQWTTADEFQLEKGFSSEGVALGTNEFGDIIAVGWGAAASETLAVTRQSLDLGQNWQPLSTFSYPPGATWCDFYAVANYGQTLYAGGAAGGSWLIVQSTDGGNTWQVSDSLPGGPGAMCRAVAVDGSGNLFATGTIALNGYVYPIVRKQAAGGSGWSTVYQAAAPGGSGGGIAFHPTAGVFVIGSLSHGNQSAWTVLKSPDGGNTWAVSDSYLPSGKISGSEGCGIAVDPQGNVYATGGVGDYWVTRRSTDGGATWNTIDTFTEFGGSQGASVSFDYQGNVYVAGHGVAGSKKGYYYYWGVRELPAGGNSWQFSDTVEFFSGALAEPYPTQSSILSADGGHVLLVTGYAFDSSSVAHWVTRRLVVP